MTEEPETTDETQEEESDGIINVQQDPDEDEALNS